MKRLSRFAFLLFLLGLSVPVFAQDAQEDSVAKLESEENAKNEVDVTDPQAEFIVRMKNNKFLRGVPLDLPMVDVYILGTKIPVPLDQVVGIRFPSNPDEKGTVALKNGEMLSGRIDPPKVVLAVEWGQAKINPSVLTEMVRDGSMQWSVRNTPNGPQWFLAPRVNRSSSLTLPSPNTFVAAPTITPRSGQSANYNVSTVSYNAPANSTIDQKEFSWIW